MEYKVSRNLYAPYVPFLKIEAYKKIIEIREQFGIPTYGEVPPKIALANVTFLLNLLASCSYIQGRDDEFESVVQGFIDDRHLSVNYLKFTKLFIVYDLGATHIDLPSMPIKFEVKRRKDNNIAIQAVLHKNFSAKEWSVIYTEQIKPIMDGDDVPTPKRLRSTTPENLRIYYWCTLRGMTASQYLKKFRPDVKNNVFWQNEINTINHDVKQKINR